MDSSKFLPGSEECSSSESGWTTYIASPDLEHDQAENEEEEEDDDDDGSIGRHPVLKKQEEADSDDSMASDASSGPSDQRLPYGYLARSRDFVHAGKKDKKKFVAKKHTQQEEKKKKQIKGENDHSGNSAGRLKKF